MNPLDKDHDSSAVDIFAPGEIYGGNSHSNSHSSKSYHPAATRRNTPPPRDEGKQAWDAEFSPILDPRYQSQKAANFELSSKMDFLDKVENLKGTYRKVLIP